MGGTALLIVGAIIGFLATYREGNWFFTPLASIIGALAGGVLFLVISGLLLTFIPTTQYTQSKEAIVPLEGSIYLGNGNVNGSIEWSYVTKTSIGDTIRSVKTDEILVNTQDNPKAPYVEKVSKRFNSAKIESLFPAEFLNGSATIVHVPANSIKYGYNLNIEN